jgi:hypothetical protein
MLVDMQAIRQPTCQGASDHRSPVGTIIQQQDHSVRRSRLSFEGAQAATDPLGFVPDRDGDNGPCCSCSARRLTIRMHFDNGSGAGTRINVRLTPSACVLSFRRRHLIAGKIQRSRSQGLLARPRQNHVPQRSEVPTSFSTETHRPEGHEEPWIICLR